MVLSGGGSNGAWEAGVVYGLVHNAENIDDYKWDVLTGISAGSWNSAYIAGWDKGTEVEMSEWLSGVWNRTTTTDLYNPIDGKRKDKAAE